MAVDYEKNNNNAVEVSQQTPETDIGSRSGQHNPWEATQVTRPTGSDFNFEMSLVKEVSQVTL